MRRRGTAIAHQEAMSTPYVLPSRRRYADRHEAGVALAGRLLAFAGRNAVVLALSDGRIEGREKAFVDQLQSALKVDDVTALRIVEVLLIKNRA